MLIILFLFALIRTLQGVPVLSPLDAPVLYLRDAGDHIGQRTVSDIVTSCIATIFACTWSAVHPNVPAPNDSGWTCFKRQFLIMVYALLAPEAITAWALRQHLAAKNIMDEYNKDKRTLKSNFIIRMIKGFFEDPPPLPAGPPRWTLTHGFFLQMGGFMLSDNGQPIQTIAPRPRNGRIVVENGLSESGRPIQILSSLSDYTAIDSGDFSPDIQTIINNKIIDPPLTTKEDIQDRSKGDVISKTLIVLQTTWFIAQCTARWFNHLPVTELEVITLGFALLNGVTCYFWWHKPQNVGRPVFLEIKPDKRQMFSHLARVESSATDFSSSTATLVTSVQSGAQGTTDDEQIQKGSENPTATSKKVPYPRRTLSKDVDDHRQQPWVLLWLLPLHFIGAFLRPIGKLAEVEVGEHLKRSIVKRGDLRVPMFFSASADDKLVHKLTALIGILFGSVHLTTSWTLEFTSAQQMLLWRCSAVIITIAPSFLMLWGERVFINVIVAIWLVLYIVARVILFSLTLMSLRTLSPAALETIEWTTFLPHI